MAEAEDFRGRPICKIRLKRDKKAYEGALPRLASGNICPPDGRFATSSFMSFTRDNGLVRFFRVILTSTM